jgi:hypothetical protein
MTVLLDTRIREYDGIIGYPHSRVWRRIREYDGIIGDCIREYDGIIGYLYWRVIGKFKHCIRL